MDLAQQERGERVARGGDVVAVGVVPAGAQAIEVEHAAGVGGPALIVELMMAEFVAQLETVPAADIGKVVGKLPAVDGFETKAGPTNAELGVWDVAGKGEVGSAGALVDEAAPVRAPQLVRPTHPGRQRCAAHEPAVPRNGGVIEQIVLDHIVELLRGMVGGDSLHEADAEILVVLLGGHPRIELGVAALYFAAVTDRRAFGPEETGGALELVGKLVVHAEHDGAEIGVPGLIARRIAGHVERQAGTVRAHHQRHDLVCHRAEQAHRNPVAREWVARRHAVHGSRAGRVVDRPRRQRTAQRVGPGRGAGQLRAEVAPLEGVDRGGVAKTR